MRFVFKPVTPTGTTPPKLFSGGISDWVLFAVAMLSLVLVAWQNFFHVSRDVLWWIRTVDYTVCSIFAFEFFYHWRQDGWTRQYLARNWYAFLGMIPVTNVMFKDWPILRLILATARLGRAVDRILGDGFTFRLVNRVKDIVVGAIAGTITVAVLNEVAEVLAKGTYTRNISRALAENQDELRDMVREKLREDPQTGKLGWLPYYDTIVESVIMAVLRVTQGILNDPRTDELVGDLLRENITQIRQAVEQAQADKPD